MDQNNVKIIKVAASSSVPQLSGSIVICVEQGSRVELRAVGASAVNQMYKALASARGVLGSKGYDMYIKPGFKTVKEDDREKTVMTARIVLE